SGVIAGDERDRIVSVVHALLFSIDFTQTRSCGCSGFGWPVGSRKPSVTSALRASPLAESFFGNGGRPTKASASLQVRPSAEALAKAACSRNRRRSALLRLRRTISGGWTDLSGRWKPGKSRVSDHRPAMVDPPK